MTNLEEINRKLEKLWDYLDNMPVDKSEEELNDLIVEAMEQVEEIIDDVNEIQGELEEVDIKLQNIIRNV